MDRLISREYAEPNCEGFVKRLRRERDLLFAFVTAGIPYHNNAERDMRPGVIARKIGGGSCSWKGAEFQSILMSVDTCRLRGVDFKFGIECLRGLRMLELVSGPTTSGLQVRHRVPARGDKGASGGQGRRCGGKRLQNRELVPLE